MNASNQNRDVESTRMEAVRISKWLKVPIVPATSGKIISVKNWTNLTIAKSRAPAALRKFRDGHLNIAAVLGGDIFTIDVDDEELFFQMLQGNPLLKDTLFSTGSGIGGNFWLRPIGPCPKSTTLKRSRADTGKLEQVGEIRAARCATIIHGYHAESGNNYYHNDKEPLRVDIAKIVWPKGIYPYNPEIEDQFTEKAEGYRVDTDDVIIAPGFAVQSIEQAVAISTPTKPNSSDKLMFRFCRALLSFQLYRECKLSTDELEQAFALWFGKAKPFLSGPFSRYKLEFFHRFRRARSPLGPSKIVLRALSRADNECPPKEAQLFADDHLLVRLISFLYYMQQEAGDQAFWISTRDLGSLLGVSHSKAAEWLNALKMEPYQLIKQVTESTATSSPRLRFVGVGQKCQT